MGLFDSLKRKKSDKPADTAVSSEKKDTASRRSAVLSEKSSSAVAQASDAKKTTGTKEKKATEAKGKKSDTGQAYRVLLHPLITEKGSYLGAYNQYMFAVALRTNKIEVKKAIRAVYGVDPVKVRIVTVMGKSVRYGKTQGRTKNWKKAIVSLPEGQKIEIQEGL
ncbi:MAG: 50S ribosomal protein L23 [Candidatus Kerfeldbacteria bacterium]|nr:50S ribosomal protein L23 [Candidatus Kerfeldbacteria bacterium]